MHYYGYIPPPAVSFRGASTRAPCFLKRRYAAQCFDLGAGGNNTVNGDAEADLLEGGAGNYVLNGGAQ